MEFYDDDKVGETIIVKANRTPTSLDSKLGFDRYPDENRFPGTFAGQHVFKYSNGHYRHGVPEDCEDRTFIEQSLGFKLDEPTDPKYKEYFQELRIDLSEINFYNKDNPEHLLIIYALQADKTDVANSIDDANASMSPKPFVIERIGEDEGDKAGKKKKLNGAYAKLADLDENNPDFMVALANFIAPTSIGRLNPNTAYLFIDEFLKGKYNNGSELEAVNQFNKLLSDSKDKIIVGSVVKEAIFKNVIRKEQSKYVNGLSKTVLGNTEIDVINFLLKDENQEELGMGLPTDQSWSIREQLRRKANYK